MKLSKKAYASFYGTILAAFLVACAPEEGADDRRPAAGDWMAEGDPDHPYGPIRPGADVRGEKNFAELINRYAQATPVRPPWIAYWWPYTGNGIANGSQTGGSSPAGKYDAARGYSTSSEIWEVMNHGMSTRGVQSWWGHCNGWCAAAALFAEPVAPTRVNGVEFGVGDIKALLTEAAMEVSADFYGNRVDWGSDFDSPKMEDTIPAQYFLVLTNYMGKLGQTVLIDRYTTDQVWNQPVAGYRFEYPRPSDYLGASREAPDVHRIIVRSTIWWARDDVPANDLTVPFEYAPNMHYEERPLEMELWLDGPVEFDASGKIVKSGDVIVAREGDWLVGGRWAHEGFGGTDMHPDYMWVPFSVIRPAPQAEKPYANIFVDVDWLVKHVVTGQDDASVTSPGTPRPAPGFTRPGGGGPSNPTRPAPTPAPSSDPAPPSSGPGVLPAPGPAPSGNPSPITVPGVPDDVPVPVPSPSFGPRR